MSAILKPFLYDETGRKINETLGQIRDILLRDETAVEKKDISFYDYGGTLLYSYTVEEANALTALPAGPTHEGLVFDGWNWSLEDVKSLTRPMNIGAMYSTNDGATRIYIHIEEGRTDIKFGICVNGNVRVDWGDGTSEDNLVGTDLTIPQYTQVHSYASPGDYVIKLVINGEAQLNENFSSINSKQLRESTTKIEIGENITIGTHAFDRYSSLLNITIPSHITSLGASAFYECRSLLSITIPSEVTRLEGYVFYYCNSLSTITIPKSIEYLGEGEFAGCALLQNITLPDLIPSIEAYSFSGCCSLSNIIIPARANTIETNAFENCYLLSNVVIPDRLMYIKDNAFNQCQSLSSITIPDNNNITSIGEYAFQGCILSSITIPNRVTSIETGTFAACGQLLNIMIPNGVKYINRTAFNNCVSLSTVTFPDGLVSIGDVAFAFCGEVTYYDFTQLSSIPKLSGPDTFFGIPADCEIRVPASLEEQWKTATNWTKYADHIIGV